MRLGASSRRSALGSTTYELLDDYRLALAAAPQHSTEWSRLNAFSKFVDGEAHKLHKYLAIQGFCFQQAHNNFMDGAVADAADAAKERIVEDTCLFLARPCSRGTHMTTTKALVRIMEGHTAPVTALAVSPDGRRVFSGSNDSTIRVLEAGLRALRREYSVFTATLLLRCCITPDGLQAASLDGDGGLLLWDTWSGRVLNRVAGRQQWDVTSLSISPDGQWVLGGFSDKEALLWDCSAAECYSIVAGESRRNDCRCYLEVRSMNGTRTNLEFTLTTVFYLSKGF